MNYLEAKKVRDGFLSDICIERLATYASMTPGSNVPGTDDEKAETCLLKLQEWSLEPLAFINDIGWTPDPLGRFGGGKLLEGKAPPRMVPMVPYPRQRELISQLHEMVKMGEEVMHLNLVKDRQVAATNTVLLFFVWAWLFHPGFKALLGSYEPDVIDAGGSGHREGSSLFSRFRLLLDSMVWCLPHLRFNQHTPSKFSGRKADSNNRCWLDRHEDVSMKLTRPRWVIFPGPGGSHKLLFPGAEKNTVLGKVPSDQWGKSDTFLMALMDEYGEYHRLGPGVDRKARAASMACCPHVVTQGTIPEGGGPGSEFKALKDRGNTATLTNMELLWSDVGIYMLGAFWMCPPCNEGRRYRYHEPWDGIRSAVTTAWTTTGPGPMDVREVTCEHCGHEERLSWRDISSPFFERTKDQYGHDRISIARYYMRDFGASMEDMFFHTFDRGRIMEREDHPRCFSVDGFDPGQSSKYPAAWVLTRFDPKMMRPRVVAGWMAHNKFIEWWIPFFKRWTSRQTKRMVVPYGQNAGKQWARAFYYSDEEFRFMDWVARFRPGHIYSDLSITHKYMTASPHDVLMSYGIYVDAEYTKDREALCRSGIEWASRVELDPAWCDVSPTSEMNKKLPSVQKWFTTARAKPHTGQSDYKLDVDKQDPPHVNNGVDAWLAACRGFPDSIHAVATAGGEWQQDPYRDDDNVVVYGGDGTLGL